VTTARRLLGDWDVLSAVAVVVLAIGAAQLIGGAFAFGLAFDEPIHQDRTVGWIEHGWYIAPYWLEDGEPDPETKYSTPWVYGPATSAISHAVNAIVGNGGWDEVPSSQASYQVRHLVVALIGALAVAAVGIAVWLFTRSPGMGLWGAAAMLAVPRFSGHAFFNPKDIPAASGYTLVTVGLLYALLEDTGHPLSRRRQVSIGATLAVGIFVGAGTRLSLWLPFALTIFAYAALRVARARLGGMARDKGTDIAVAVGAAVGFLAIAALYPNAARTPITLLVESVSNSAGYDYKGQILTAGRLVSAHPPIWYLPAWISVTYPLLLGAFALLGAGAGIWTLVKARSGIWRRRDLGLLLVLQQAAMLPVAVLLNGGLMYNGMRQHLYVLPALTILAGVGAWRLLTWAKSRRSARVWTPISVATLCLALAMPMAAQLVLFPYNYTYFNPVAALTGGVNDRWETDYWWGSLSNAYKRIPLNVPVRCSPDLRTRNPIEKVEFEDCAGGDRIDIVADERGTDVAEGALDGPPAVWVLGRKREGNSPPPYCEDGGNITRWLWGETVTISYVLRCDPDRIPPLDSE
jgi:hypothetical protein